MRKNIYKLWKLRHCNFDRQGSKNFFLFFLNHVHQENFDWSNLTVNKLPFQSILSLIQN